MPAPDLQTSAQRASKIHHLDAVTSLDTIADTDLFVIDRQDPVTGLWLNYKITGADLKAAMAPAATVVPAEDSTQDGQVIEMFDDYDLGAISAFNKGTGWLNDGVGSGCSIVSKTQADGRIHKRLQITAGQYGRTLPWGKYWNRLKVVILCRVNDIATINNVDGYIGFCNGTANMVASATTNNFIGIRWGDGASQALFTAGTLINYYNMSVSFRFHTRRGTTSTLIAGGGSGHSVSAAEGYLSPLLFEVSRPPAATDNSSITYSVKEASPPASLVESSRPKDLIKGLLGSSGTSILSMSELETAVIGNAGNSTGTFDQSTGGLDTVNISWPQNSGFEIAAIGVRKIH